MELIDTNSKKRLRRLFNYDIWANEQILHCLQQHLGFKDNKHSIRYYAHFIGIKDLWHRRIKQEPLDDLTFWPDYGLPDALQKIKTLSGQWKQLMNSGTLGLDENISYNNSQDISYKTKLPAIFQHIIIHGQHHRTQIVTLLRKANIKPPDIDFIYFCRAN